MTDVDSALSKLDAVHDLMTVKKVFGDAYERDGVTLIPVAEVRGNAGGGGGTEPRGEGKGFGTGIGFGIRARPSGAFVIKDGDVEWQPAIDVTRMVIGGQLVAIGVLLLPRGALILRRATS